MNGFEKNIGGQKEPELPPWESTIEAIVADRVKSLDSAHDAGHHRRTLKLAENLLSHIGADSDERKIVVAGTLLHDNFMYPKNHPLARSETDIAAEHAKNYLEATDFPKKLIPRVCAAIKQSSFAKGEWPESREGILVYLADKLDQTGLFAYLRYLASGGKMGRPLFNKEDPLAREHRPREPLGFTFDALLNRIPKIQRSFIRMGFELPGVDILRSEADAYFPSGKKRGFEPVLATAKKRNEFLKLILRESELEIAESKKFAGASWLQKTGTAFIEKLFQEAGKNDKAFYHLEDPLVTTERKLQPKVYPVDALIKLRGDLQKGESFGTPPEILARRKKFLDDFFMEFEFELAGKLITPEEPSEREKLAALIKKKGAH